MALTIALVVTLWVGYLIYKKYKPQPVLVVGGFILMYIAVIMGYGKIVAPKASTGTILFDTFQFMSMTLSSRAAKLGLNIMCVGAFAKYMDAIGASRALVRMTIKPLLKLKSPYLVLALSWILGLVIGLCINSASGLAMLLMVTVFPILVGLGVSRLAATAAVASTLCFDWSPSDTGTILSAETAGIDPVIYWTDYQVPIVIVAFFVVSALFYFSQKYMDKKAGHVVKPVDVDSQETSDDPRDHAPAIYALLPVVPLALILCFSPLWITWIKVNIINAMMIGLAVGMIAEYIRSRNLKEVFAGVQAFFDGMGLQMANVVTLIVAGQVFAQGLMSMGVIDSPSFPCPPSSWVPATPPSSRSPRSRRPWHRPAASPLCSSCCPCISQLPSPVRAPRSRPSSSYRAAWATYRPLTWSSVRSSPCAAPWSSTSP